MREEISIREWQKRFAGGEYEEPDFDTQVKAGWYDWFCNDSSLAGKTRKMGKVVAKVKSGGKVDIDNWYVWFKNNCPMVGPLYDDFRFADMKTGDVMFTIAINPRNRGYRRYSVYGRKPVKGEYVPHFGEPMFECDDMRTLVAWLNKPWEE